MKKFVTLEFHRGSLNFAAGHFTIFSATERERLHGHNYYVEAKVTAALFEPGITFNYSILKKKLKNICDSLDSYFLIPENSPYLKIKEEGKNILIFFADELLTFPKKDVKLLPISNASLEDLSHWLLEEIIKDKTFIEKYHVSSISLKLFNGLEQSALTEFNL